MIKQPLKNGCFLIHAGAANGRPYIVVTTLSFAALVEGPKGCAMIASVRTALSAGFARPYLKPPFRRSPGRGAQKMFNDCPCSKRIISGHCPP